MTAPLPDCEFQGAALHGRAVPDSTLRHTKPSDDFVHGIPWASRILTHCCIDIYLIILADSSGGCNAGVLCRGFRLIDGVEQFDDPLAGLHESKGLAWSVVEFLGDRVEVVLGVDG